MNRNFHNMINSYTEYGEPQIWVTGLPGDRNLEITHEEYGIPKERQFYSIRLHCNDAEFENKDYGDFGIIDAYTTDTFDYDKIMEWAIRVSEEELF